jgi:hypothetical protein
VGGCILDAQGKETEFGGAELNVLGFGFQRSSWHPGFTPRGEGEPMPFACGGAMAVQKDAFAAVGGFDEDYFAYYEDVDLGWRLNLGGGTVVFSPGATVRHRKHATSSRFSDRWRHRHWYKNILQTLVKDAEEAHLGRLFPAALAVLLSRIGSFHQEAVRARDRGDAVEAERQLEIALGASEGLTWVLDQIDHVLGKRAAVQARRRVTDATLRERFGLHADFGPETAHWTQNALARRLLDLFDVSALLGPRAPAADAPALHAALAENARLRHDLAAVQGSLTWRATAPLRAALDALRRG